MRLVGVLLVAAFAWGAEVACLRHLQDLHAEARTPFAAPDPTLTQLAATDYDNLAADVLWLQVLQYNGEQLTHLDSRDRDYRGVHDGLALVLDLDPRFHEAALFGSWVLADGDRVDEARDLLVSGLKRWPDHWEYPFQLGFLEFLYARRYDLAAEAFMAASRLPGCPPAAPRMAASLYARGSKAELAIETWRAIYARGDAHIRGIAERALKKLGAPIASPTPREGGGG